MTPTPAQIRELARAVLTGSFYGTKKVPDDAPVDHDGTGGAYVTIRVHIPDLNWKPGPWEPVKKKRAKP